MTKMVLILIGIDYEDEESLQETLHTDTRILKLNNRNIKGQSHLYNIIEEQKFHNSQKNSRTDPIARPASIICVMPPREQFNRVDHESNPIQTMTLTACPVGRVP